MITISIIVLLAPQVRSCPLHYIRLSKKAKRHQDNSTDPLGFLWIVILCTKNETILNPVIFDLIVTKREKSIKTIYLCVYTICLIISTWMEWQKKKRKGSQSCQLMMEASCFSDWVHCCGTNIMFFCFFIIIWKYSPGGIKI